MQDIYSDALSVRYHYGAKTVLSESWHDKNVICPDSKIYYVIDGEIAVECEGKKYVATKNEAILIPAGTKHSYHLTELGYAEKYWFHFDLRLLQKSFFDSISVPRMAKLSDTEFISGLFEDAINGEQIGGRIGTLVSSRAVLRIIEEYLKATDFSQRDAESKDAIDEVIEHVKKNYFEKFTLEALAEMAALSPNYFLKKFKERTGHSPLKYINILRVQRAKFLLEHTDIPISTLMEEIGFLDAAHFSKLFKMHTGYSPRRFRASFEKR